MKSSLCLILRSYFPTWRLRRKLSGGKSACASRTEKVHRAEVQDVPLRRKKACRGAEATQADGLRAVQPERAAVSTPKILLNWRKWASRRYLAVVDLFLKCFWFNSSSFKQHMLPLRLLSGFLETILLPKQTKKLLW